LDPAGRRDARKGRRLAIERAEPTERHRREIWSRLPPTGCAPGASVCHASLQRCNGFGDLSHPRLAAVTARYQLSDQSETVLMIVRVTFVGQRAKKSGSAWGCDGHPSWWMLLWEVIEGCRMSVRGTEEVEDDAQGAGKRGEPGCRIEAATLASRLGSEESELGDRA